MPISHKRALESNVPNWRGYTSEGYHPVSTTNELTLAWARVDLDLDRGEALIEEIQSDWVRDVKGYAESPWVHNQAAWQTYYKEYLEPKTKLWPHTILTATLWFLLEELAIKTIFFHTHASGVRLKNIKYQAPPRSIYTDLPKAFCFRTTHNGPGFLRDSKDRHVKGLFSDPETKWHIHNFA